MEKIKIIVEKYSTRCEICHQDDLFIPEENYCQRCNSLQFVKSDNKSKKQFYTDNDYGNKINDFFTTTSYSGLFSIFITIFIITLGNYLVRAILGNTFAFIFLIISLISCAFVILVNISGLVNNRKRLLTCTDKGILYSNSNLTTFIPWKRIKSISYEKDETETLVLHIFYDDKYPISGVGKYSDTFYINISSSKGYKPPGKDLFEIVNRLYKFYY